MSLTPQTEAGRIARAAENIYLAYASRPCEPIRELLVAGDIDGAYAAQEINTNRWLREGRKLVGRKIGLTSKAVQKIAGVDQPDYGMLFADMMRLDGERVPAGTLFAPKAESEIVFVMKRDLAAEQIGLVDAMSAVDYVLPALEIVDSRIARLDIKILDTIADNASSGLFVLGTRPVRLQDVDLKMCGMKLERNGEAVSFGAGLACLGHPLHGLLWLARRMVAVGRPICAGDVVLSGALGPMVDIKAGDFVEASIAGLGSVSFGLTPIDRAQQG